MERLEFKSQNCLEDKPLVKMLAICKLKGMYRIDKITNNIPATNKVVVHNYVFTMIMMDWISVHVSGIDIITMQVNRIMNDNPKIVKDLLNPDSISNSIAYSSRLHVNGGFGDCGLLIRMLSNKIVSKIYCITCSGAAKILTGSLVSI